MKSCLRTPFLIGSLSLSAIFGCEEPIIDTPEVKAVRDKIALVFHEADTGAPAFGCWREIEEMAGLFNDVPDQGYRCKLVEEYGKLLLSIDVSRPPYRRIENVAFGFFPHMDEVIRLMRESGYPSRRQLDFFFSGLSKFKTACLTVPNDSKIPGEDSKECLWRMDCAHKLPLEYDQRMSEIRRFWLPQLDKRFPAECHDEFKRRIAPFLDVRHDKGSVEKRDTHKTGAVHITSPVSNAAPKRQSINPQGNSGTYER